MGLVIGSFVYHCAMNWYDSVYDSKTICFIDHRASVLGRPSLLRFLGNSKQ